MVKPASAAQLSRASIGLRLAGVAVAGLGVMAAFGCTSTDAASSAASSSSAATESGEGVVLTMEYADGSDALNHKSVEVTDASQVAEGAQFVNGVGAENTYVYKGYAHGDNAHYSMYSLYTELITDEDGLLTAVNLTSGNDTWANKWGDLGANPTITGHLPEGVSFDYTEENGVITPALTVEAGSDAEAAGYSVSAIYLYNVADDLTTVGSDVEGRRGTTHNEYDASISLDAVTVDDDDDDEAAAGKGGSSETASDKSGKSGEAASGESGERSGHGDKSGSGEAASGESGERSGHGQAGGEAAEASVEAAEPSGYSYDAETGAITIEDGAYNLIQIQYKFGTETVFNEFIAVDGNENASKYVDANFEETDLDVIDVVDNTGVTNRTKWTYSMLSLMVQREFASWGATFEDTSLYTGKDNGEIGDIDTISGATKTSVPFQSALNQAVEAGYVTGVAEDLVATIDGGSDATDGIDVTGVPQDQTTVTVNDEGLYEITFNFPAGIDESGGNDGGQHAISPNNVEVYALGDEDLGTLGVWNLGKGTAGFTPLAAYADSSQTPGDADDEYATYVSDWDYPYTPTLTVKDPSVTHVVVYYTIGHETLGIAYDLAAMVEAGEVQALIDELDASDAAAVTAAREAYDALTYDVKGTVDAEKLFAAESK